MADRFRYLDSEGGLLPTTFLERLAANDRSVPGLAPADYHLGESERLSEAIASAWNRLLPAWRSFQSARESAGAAEALTGPTRERWLLPLFAALGFGRLASARSVEVEGRSYPVSHAWSQLPIHLVGVGVDLDRRTAGVAGAAKASPHGLVQELLNRSDAALWGVVSNGSKLRLLRDSASLARQAYLEFDLEGIFSEEAFGEFTLLFLLVHPSRFEGERPEQWLIERWARDAAEQGTRALDSLRDGVQAAITALGRGCLELPSNRELRDALSSGALSTQDFYRELLREVYRLIFLFVAEDRGLLHPSASGERERDRYARFFSTSRLRRLAARRIGTRHVDLWFAYRQVVAALSSAGGLSELGLPALGGFLFSSASTPWLDRVGLANRDLLEAVRALSTTKVAGGRLVTVDWRSLGSEELGSVYEALLELHPIVHLEAPSFELSTAAGHERKTTGSYYTPSSLIQCLLDSALDPVIAEAAKQPSPEQALLALKICDPACGSGHFLIAAAHRLSKRVAAVRSGEEEPSPEAVRGALRDVIGHCLYGVDLNPMAVELCKVNLWLESLSPGRPLSFLDHHIQCGNSLLGTTPALLAKGIPDEAFTAIEGDDKEVVKKFKTFNKQERREWESGQATFAFEPWDRIGHLATELAALESLPDGSVVEVRAKERRYAELVASADYEAGRFLADTWCAAFVWRKVAAPGYPEPITERIFRDIEKNPELGTARSVRDLIRRMAEDFRFFHWHLAFPDVFRVPARGTNPENEEMGWSGGFDCLLGNPPWDQVQFDDQEFFAERRPDISEASSMAKRKRMIESLRTTDPTLWEAYCEASRRSDVEKSFAHGSGRFPLTSFGRLNLSGLFAEVGTQLPGRSGRTGLILPAGIATDSFNQYFFQKIVGGLRLVSLFHFENEERVFVGVHHAFRFVLLTTSASSLTAGESQVACFLRSVAELRDPERRYRLSAEDFALLNPNTLTCPIFRSRRDAEVTKAIYGRVPVLVNEAAGESGNAWGFSGLLMFMMNTDSVLFQTSPELEKQGYRLERNVFTSASSDYLPLYEAKMVHQFDHRFGTYAGQTEEQANQGKLPELTDEDHADPWLEPVPRYWVPEAEVAARLANRWDRGWLLGWRDITSATVTRTVIASVIPQVGVGNQFPLMLVSNQRHATLLASVLSSLVLDFVARQKAGGTHLNFFIFNQLPVLPPVALEERTPWARALTLAAWLTPLTLELTFTAHDLAPFARDCGWGGPPFRWDPERRFEIRCELDAAFFHLYGIAREDVDYILETFSIVKRKDIERHGNYRTKLRILKIYDALLRAIETEEPYQTLLDPPPGDPRAAHGAE